MGETERRRDPLSTKINLGPEAPAEPKNLAEELGHEPSEFESKLLAHPSDKDGQKKLHVELMLDQAGYGIGNLNRIKNPDAQKRINELAVEYIKATEKGGSNEIRERRKAIAAEARAILDKTFDEE